MNIFFDTTVLVAASERSHPHFAQAHFALRRVIEGKDKGYISAHSIAEVYAVLTRLPVQPRIHPAEAFRIITESLLPYFEIIPASLEHYLEAMQRMANGGWIGAKIYDALLLHWAAASGAERVYTFNLRDFLPLAPTSLEGKISAP